jgi:hypothetical protein
VGLYGFIKQHFNPPYINWKGFGVRQFIAALNYAQIAPLEKSGDKSPQSKIAVLRSTLFFHWKLGQTI